MNIETIRAVTIKLTALMVFFGHASNRPHLIRADAPLAYGAQRSKHFLYSLGIIP